MSGLLRDGCGCALCGAGDKKSVLGEGAASWLGSRWNPWSSHEVLLAVEQSRGDIEHDDITIAESPDGPAHSGLGSHMTHHEAMGRTREASIGEQRDRVAKASTLDGRCHCEHLSHSRSTLGAFVANDQHITRLDHTILNRCKAGLLTVKDASGTPMTPTGMPSPMSSAEGATSAAGRQPAPADDLAVPGGHARRNSNNPQSRHPRVSWNAKAQKWIGQARNMLQQTASGGPKYEYTSYFPKDQEDACGAATAALRARLEGEYWEEMKKRAAADLST